MNCIFLTQKIIPGEWYGRKILKKIPDVPLSENLTTDFSEIR